MHVIEWVEAFADGWFWYVKRLSGNDTLANGSHQAGPYIPKPVFFHAFPALEQQTDRNADTLFTLIIDSHPDIREARAIWYNNKLWGGGTRNETRITNLGGKESPLLDPESTGALTVFAFPSEVKDCAHECHVWICRNDLEEEVIENIVGPVEPGNWTLWPSEKGLLQELNRITRASCRLSREEIPAEWIKKFPSGEEIIEKVVDLRPDLQMPTDDRLLRRRYCEYELFKSLEEAIELPEIQQGFTSIDDFLKKAQSILQRRKARSGRSLELHIRKILIEEGFQEGKHFTYQPQVGNRPDFLFPNEQTYRDTSVPREKIRMLAVKTTLRDRWRQVTEECPDLPVKHLLTLQEGISEKQFQLINEANIRLVVPEGLHSKFRKDIQPKLISLESFLAEIRLAII